jgi:hypothetical protein
MLGWLLAGAVVAYELGYPAVLGTADESFFLDSALRVMRGSRLYHDVFLYWTPLGSYLFAGIFALAGPSFLAARIATAALNGLSAWVLFHLARRVAGVPEAIVAVMVFATICLPVWPGASPHWIATTGSLATAALLLSDRLAGLPRVRAAAAGFMTGLTACVLQHRGLALAAWVAAALLVLAAASTTPARYRRAFREMLWAAGGAVAAVLPILGYAVARSSVRELMENVFGFVFGTYYSYNVGQVPWGGGGMLSLIGARFTWRWLLRSVPLLLAVEGLRLVLALAVRRRWGRAEALRACVLLLAGAMAVSILYYPDYIHVATIGPFWLLVAAGLLHDVRAATLWRRIPFGSTVAAGALAVAGFAVAAKGWDNLATQRAASPLRIETAIGRIAGDDGIRGHVEFMQRELAFKAGRPRIFVYPFDAWIYVAMDADNATPFGLLYARYSPPEHFARVRAALMQQPADFVVVNILRVKAGDPFVPFLAGRYQLVAERFPYRIYRGPGLTNRPALPPGA